MLNPKKTHCPPKKIVRILKYTCIVVFVLLCIGVAYQRIGDYVEMKTITPPGMMVDVEGHKMHLVCMGEVKKNRPTVILEAGAGGYWDSWNTIQSEIAKSTYVCSYDREGLGFSESTPTAHAAKDVAHQLDALLLVAHVPGPYLLVGHSLGGIYIRYFADIRKDALTGMIYIDPTPEKLKELELNHPPSLTDVVIGESFNIFLKWGSQIGVLKLITHVAPNLADGIAGAHLSSWDLLFAGQREYIQRSFGEFEDASLIKNIPIPSENIPFTVLSARESLDFAPELFEMREDLCHLSKACRHVVVENSSHDVMGDQPEMVIREILRFVQ